MEDDKRRSHCFPFEKLLPEMAHPSQLFGGFYVGSNCHNLGLNGKYANVVKPCWVLRIIPSQFPCLGSASWTLMRNRRRRAGNKNNKRHDQLSPLPESSLQNWTHPAMFTGCKIKKMEDGIRDSADFDLAQNWFYCLHTGAGVWVVTWQGLSLYSGLVNCNLD